MRSDQAEEPHPGRRLHRPYRPRWVALAGVVLVTAATVPFACATAETSKVSLMAALLVRGIGMGATMIPLDGAAYVGPRHEGIPDAGIITRVAQQIGGSAGTAVLAAVLQHTTGDAHHTGPRVGAVCRGGTCARARLEALRSWIVLRSPDLVLMSRCCGG